MKKDGSEQTKEGNASRCVACGAEFSCGMASGMQQCWCMEKPTLYVEGEMVGCYCPNCLDKKLAEQSGQ